MPSNRHFDHLARQRVGHKGCPEPPSLIYQDAATGGGLYLGGKTEAKNIEWLRAHSIVAVITCLDHTLLSEGFALP